MLLLKSLLTFLFAISLHCSFAQIEPKDSLFIPNIKSEGDTMTKLFIAKDYKAFAKYTYLPIIEKLGGEEKMIQRIKDELDKFEKEGIVFLNCTVSAPTNIVHYKKTIQCVLNEKIEMKIPDCYLTAISSLIGISTDNGKKWVFIDTHGKDLKSLQLETPGLSNSLIIPEQPKPVFVHD